MNDDNRNLNTYVVSVKMAKVVPTDMPRVRQSEPARTREWIVTAPDEEDAFDRAVAYFLLGSPKSVLRSGHQEPMAVLVEAVHAVIRAYGASWPLEGPMKRLEEAIDFRPRCKRCGRRWIPDDGEDAKETPCDVCRLRVVDSPKDRTPNKEGT